jgi:hypothetical protein
VRTDKPSRSTPSMNNMTFHEASHAASRREQPHWKLWLAVTSLVTVATAVATLLSPWVRHEWVLSLFRQNTPYTQLGFNDATKLPVTAVRGKGVPVSFFVTNDEGKPTAYQYVVASGSGPKLESLSSATKTVAAGATWDVHVTVVPKCAETTCRIEVSLPREGESIDLLLTYGSKDSKKSK